MESISADKIAQELLEHCLASRPWPEHLLDALIQPAGNSALFRIAAVYHRTLKITVGRPTTRDDVPTLRTQVENLYRQWKQAEWSSGHVHLVHSQVNDLKHTPRGVHDRRKVTYQDALAAIGELLDLIEAWTGSRVQTP